MRKGTKTVYVVAATRQSVQGRHNYSVDLTNGTKVTMERSRAKGINIPIGFVRQGSKLKTGMDVILDNPYYQLELNELDDNDKPGSHWVDKYDAIKTREKIDRQTLYEFLDNVPQGTYSSVVGRSTMAEIGADVQKFIKETSNFLETFSVYLHEGVNPFSDNTQRGRLGILACENHPKVARNRDLFNPDMHEFYIGSEEEAVVLKNRKIDRVMDTVADLKLLQREHPKFDMYQIAVVLGIAQGDVKETTLEMLLKDFVWEAKKTNEGTQEERLDKFDAIFSLLKENPDRLYIRYLMKQALNSGVFQISGARHVMWPNKKGYPNLYDLGTNVPKIENMFLEQYNLYTPMENADQESDNWYFDLERDLKARGIRCK